MALKIVKATTKPFSNTMSDIKYVSSVQNKKVITVIGDRDGFGYGYAAYTKQFAFGLNPQFLNNAYATNYAQLVNAVGVCTKRKHSMEIINNQTQDAYITIYWAKCRHDNFTSGGMYLDSNALLSDSINLETGVVASAGWLQNLLPSYNVFDFNKFLSFFKIIKSNKFKLQPGHSKKFTEVKSTPLWMNGYYYGQNQYSAYGGKTVFPIIECRGELMHETGSTDANCATIGTGKTKIGVYYEATYEFYQVNTQTSQMKNYTTGLAAVAVPVSMQMSNPSNTALFA